ncbi:pyruvate flavodoxin/ferredoxin oxidoreductase thiamine dip-bdg [Lucifera butyrica]|uniref:Pyruvate flavodoxin/ferredoxin oxidoreductase thiamine dip-bdg n=1 Tax=Lucifera butyrica TaxID=1351585 RepID=A0A498R2I8_9FIRM|nr:2-oxoacid:acceptor oxidoreductase subunit alpha [Lucifera butyrica]VBB06846.1 pyruvate flavodoxin/ferredoxin oxidoreductase thiamine dip-bdg [Lucifera butyrica]
MTKARLMQGNQACTEGALAAGVSFFAGYPITPSTEIAEILAESLPKLGGKFIQMEDEIASMGAVCGAALTGAKAITATSGPGFSLKQELIGYAAMAEIPVVIVNVQRLGPSTGKPTSPAQGDVMQARWGTHGDHGVIVLSPGSVRECFDITVKAVNFSEQFRVPVILLLDEVIGHMRERVELPAWSSIEIVNRKLPSVPPAEYLAYKPDADGVPSMAPFGEGYYYHVTGLVHNYSGMPVQSVSMTDELIRRLHTKLEMHSDEITLYTEDYLDDAEYVVIAYGGSSRAAIAAVKAARERGIKAGLLKLITIWPFPVQVVQKVTRSARKVIVPEMNYGQLAGEIERYAGRDKVVSVTRVDGELFKPEEILSPILTAAGGIR